ncbi:MAG: sigma-70 family RNA polymerase sigma factor [Actinomycetales bacterium]
MSGRGDALEGGRAEREANARRLLDDLPQADPDQQLRIREELVQAHLGLVRALAGKYRGRGEPMDDLVQAGSIGLLRAIDGFDPGRGSDFGSYAVACILGSIRQHFRDESWSITLSRQVKERIRAIDRLVEEAAAATGQTPTVRELASALDLSPEEVLEAMDAARVRNMAPLDAPDQHGRELVDALCDSDPTLEGIPDRQVIVDALGSMPEAERQALLLTTIQAKSQAEVGAMLGVSQMQVHRLRARALERLRSAIDPPEREDETGTGPMRWL